MTPSKKIRKVKANEKIGFTFTTIGLITMFFNVYNPEMYKLLILGFCLFGQTMFLSYWGLTTFNENYAKK